MVATVKRRKKSISRRKKTGIAAIPTNQGFRKFQQIFHLDVEQKEYASIVKGYVRKKFDKKIAQAIVANPDWKFGTSNTAAYCYYSEIDGVEPVPAETVEWMNNRFADLAQIGQVLVKEQKKEEKIKATAYKPSIQERMREQLSEIIGEFEGWVDAQPGADIPKFFDYLKKNSVAQAHISKIRSYYEPVAAEFRALTQKDCPEDLAEGYAHLSKSDVKHMIKFFDAMLGDLDAYANLKKATRATRKPKPKSADKLVSKLKIKKDDARFKITSVDPTKIVGATEIWVFNTKTRKLGRYVAQPNTEFTVKGTTLQFFDEKQSVQKTLRKPEEQIKEFMGSGKVALRKFLDNIRAVETKMNGRLNKDTVLLKVS